MRHRLMLHIKLTGWSVVNIRLNDGPDMRAVKYSHLREELTRQIICLQAPCSKPHGDTKLLLFISCTIKALIDNVKVQRIYKKMQQSSSEIEVRAPLHLQCPCSFHIFQ